MAEGITISGLDDCLRFCDNAPKEMFNLCKEAMKEGGRVSSKYLRGRVDRRWRKLVKAKTTTKSGKLNTGIGLWAKNNKFDWFKAYWKNYGTLTKRDPGHSFQSPVRSANQAVAKRRRNNVGQPHENFFEGAIKGYDEKFVEAFENYIDKHIDECYGK